MQTIFEFTFLNIGRILAFAMQHMVALLIVMGIIGFIIYLAGEVIRKKGLAKVVEGTATDFPYKPVALSLNILGVVVMIVVAILMYFAGGYDPVFAKLGW